MVSNELVPQMMQEKRERNAPSPVCINTTKNIRSSVCHYVSIMCTHKAFAGCHNTCRILVHICICTNGLALRSTGTKISWFSRARYPHIHETILASRFYRINTENFTVSISKCHLSGLQWWKTTSHGILSWTPGNSSFLPQAVPALV